jgi:RimJ/RimL family protein N-acetyltransferase
MNAAREREGFRRQIGPGIEMRLFTPADAESVFDLTEENREYLRRWLPWVDRTHSVADVRQFIAEVVTPQWLDNRGPNCGIWVEGALEGSIGCHPIDWQNRACSLGYWIRATRIGAAAGGHPVRDRKSKKLRDPQAARIHQGGGGAPGRVGERPVGGPGGLEYPAGRMA